MTREILFRGRSLETGEWVYGYLVHGNYFDDSEMTIIVPTDVVFYPGCEMSGFEIVDPETVGQWIGMKDKNGTKIFEGDIIECITFGFDREKFVTEIKFGARSGVQGFYLANGRMMFYFGQTDLTKMDDSRVIGNIWDNPELLEKKGD